MERWSGRVAVVTGASSGIGAACIKDLVKAGCIVVGLARRLDRMQQLKSELPKDLEKKFYTAKCDVSIEDEVKSAFDWINKNLGGADILVNNAGVKYETELVKINNTKEIRQTVDTNIMGVLYCTREAFNSMKMKKINDGHVVIINSISGHRVPNFGSGIPSFNIYPATKYAITAMVETYRQEFQNHGTKFKISSISPGLVDTEIVAESFKKFNFPSLKPEDVSNAILYVLGTPPHVQIHELTIKPVGENC